MAATEQALHAQINDLNRQIFALMEKRSKVEARLDKLKKPRS